MTLSINFPFSDLIAGYVTSHDSSNDSFTLKTSDEREFKVRISAMAYAKLIQNFDEAYPDATGNMRSMLEVGRFLFVYGVFYPDSEYFDAKQIVFAGRKKNDFVFEKQNWWVNQINALGK